MVEGLPLPAVVVIAALKLWFLLLITIMWKILDKHISHHFFHSSLLQF